MNRSTKFVCLVLCIAFACAAYIQLGTLSVPNARADVQTAPIIYVAFGDSTGAGVGAADGRGYVTRLFARLEQKIPGTRLLNLSVTGATVGDVLRSQVDQAVATHPTLVTLSVGANDLIHGVKGEVFAQNYEKTVHRLKTETRAAIVITNIPDMSLAPAVPSVMRDDVRRHIVVFNEHIAQTAHRYNLPVVDIFGASHDVIPKHPGFFSQDGVHPSDAGYEFWAETMWKTVAQAVGVDTNVVEQLPSAWSNKQP